MNPRRLAGDLGGEGGGGGGEEVVRKYELSKIIGTFVQLPPKSEVGMFVMGYDK